MLKVFRLKNVNRFLGHESLSCGFALFDKRSNDAVHQSLELKQDAVWVLFQPALDHSETIGGKLWRGSDGERKRNRERGHDERQGVMSDLIYSKRKKNVTSLSTHSGHLAHYCIAGNFHQSNFIKSDRQAVRQEFIFAKCRPSFVCSSVTGSLLFCLSFIFIFMNISNLTLVVLWKKLVRNLI